MKEKPATPPDCVRLHVVAADDSPAAQALKMQARDAALAAVPTDAVKEKPATTPDCVRLHVVAADDSPAAQALKMQARDAAAPTDAVKDKPATTPDCVRLHVVAADDSPAAQALKMQARDAALAAARRMLAPCADADGAWLIIRQRQDALAEAARRRLRALGCDAPVTARAGVFAFPDRQYGGALYPAGRYRALRLTIAPGRGRNWWCVLYPDLCLPEGEAPVTFHSLLLDFLKSLFGGDDDA